MCAMLIASIVLVILLFRGTFKSKDTEDEVAKNLRDELELKEGWSEPIPVSGDRGECNVYETYTTDRKTVDGIIGTKYEDIPEDLQCNDENTIALKKVEHTCVSKDRCLGRSGRFFNKEETEIFYESCGSNAPCSGSRQAVILNFSLKQDTHKLETNALCLSDTTTPFAKNCYSNAQIFPYIDEKKVEGAKILRIRVSGTTKCFVPSGLKIVSAECKNAKDEGFVWFQLLRTTIDDSHFYPSQIVVLPDSFDQSSPEKILSQLSTLSSIQLDNDVLSVGPIKICTTNTVCLFATERISSTAWSSFV